MTEPARISCRAPRTGTPRPLSYLRHVVRCLYARQFSIGASFWESLELPGLWRGNSPTAWLVLALGVLVGFVPGGCWRPGSVGLPGGGRIAGRGGWARMALGLAGPLKLAVLASG